jgi:alpha-tubulin suppressor-like RCC1 family protein
MTRRFRASIVVAAAPFFLFGCTAILGNFDVSDVPAVNTSPEGGTTDAPTTTNEGGGGGTDGGPDADAGVPHLDHIKMVTAGAQHTCALTQSNDVYCWGHNGNGQLAQPASVARSPVPVKIAFPVGVLNITSIVAGAFHTCAVLGGGDMFCWGQNDCGQTGAGDTTNPSPPRRVVDPAPATTLKWLSVGPGDHHTCAVESGGTTYCWGCTVGDVLGGATLVGGTPPYSKPVTAGPDKAPAKLVSTSALYNCLVYTSGQLGCWGTESQGELGDGDPPTTQTGTGPAATPNIGLATSASAIATGAAHTCMVDQNRAITCWGDDSSGQLGIALTAGTQESAPGPKVLGGQANAKLITAGAKFTCYTNELDVVVCFGGNGHGELGRNLPPDSAVHSVPDNVRQPDGTGTIHATSISAGRQHACAVLTPSNDVLCWGDDTDGQLGDGQTGGSKTTPVFVVPAK